MFWRKKNHFYNDLQKDNVFFYICLNATEYNESVQMKITGHYIRQVLEFTAGV